MPIPTGGRLAYEAEPTGQTLSVSALRVWKHLQITGF